MPRSGRSRGRGMTPPGSSTAGSSTGNGRGRGRGRGARVLNPPEGELAPALSQLAIRGVRERGVRASQQEESSTAIQRIQSGPPPGKPVTLFTNYLQLVTPNGNPVYQYHVEISPEIDNERCKRGIMYNEIEELKDNIIFKNHILYTFLETIGPEKEYHVTRRSADGETTHRVTLKRTLEVKKDSTHFANVFFNYVAERTSGWKRSQRNYFDPSTTRTLERYHIQIMAGFQFRVGEFDSGPLMSIDTKHRILRTNTALELIQEIIAKRGQLRAAQTEIIRELTGRVVMTRYNNKTYKIHDVLFDMKPSDEIELRPGYKISFLEYYRNKYDITINDVNQCILLSIQKTRELDANGNEKEVSIHLVPEVCYLTGLSTQESTNTRAPLFRELSNITRSSPTDKVATLQEFATTINQSSITQRWDLTVETSLLKLQGGNIDKEELISREYQIRNGSFDQMTRKRFVLHTAGIGDNCHIICHSRDMPLALSLVEQPFARAAGIEITFKRENIVTVQSERAEAFIEAGNALLSRVLLFILPNDKADRYNAIKRRFCVNNPKITQVVLAKTLRNQKGLASKITKIMMQIDAKAGGQLWTMNLPVLSAMFVGIDTFHDSVRKGRSVGGFVASMNQNLTRYYSRVFWHGNVGDEVFSGLQPIMKDTLTEFYRLNGNRYPKRIIIFRDGVGYGQMELVREMEIEGIKRAMSELQLQGTELVFVVVAKRINTRFFEKHGTSYKNPFQGTVVSNAITKSNQAFDFYLVSQSVNQGTVSPTHYTVLEWNTSLEAEQLQRIAFRLCHMYFNWTGIISVPAPCQYAHKLAFLVGQSIHEEPAPALRHYLYYL